MYRLETGIVLTMPLSEYVELVVDGGACRARLDQIGLRDTCEGADGA
jgi:hypothetical protein